MIPLQYTQEYMRG